MAVRPLYVRVLTSGIFTASTRSGPYFEGEKSLNTGDAPGIPTRRMSVCELLVCKMAVHSGPFWRVQQAIGSERRLRFSDLKVSSTFVLGHLLIESPLPFGQSAIGTARTDASLVPYFVQHMIVDTRCTELHLISMDFNSMSRGISRPSNMV